MIRDKDFYRSIFRLALPTAFQSLISLLVVMADNLMVTRIDPDGLSFAAVAQSNSITNFVNAAMTGLAGGSVVLIAQYWGKKDTDAIRSVCSVVLSLCVGFAVAVAGLIRLFPGMALNMVISAKETRVLDLGMQYLPIVCLAYIPFAVSASMIGMLKGVEVVRITLYTTIVSLVSNILFNYILIFGKLGFPAMGVRGAAIATVLARLIEATLVSFYFFKVQRSIPIKARDFLQHKRWVWTDYARFGLPVAITDAQWALVGMLKMVIIGQMGKRMINAAAVTDMMMNLGMLFTSALAGGAAVMVGKAVGQKDYSLVRSYSRTIQIMFFFFGLIMSSLVFLLRVPYISLYNLDADVASLAATMIGISATTLIGTTYHASCFVGINRGAGDNRFVMLVDMICGWLIVLPVSALAAFVFHWPLHIVYFCTRIDQTFKWIIAFFRLRGNKWIHNVTREAGA